MKNSKKNWFIGSGAFLATCISSYLPNLSSRACFGTFCTSCNGSCMPVLLLAWLGTLFLGSCRVSRLKEKFSFKLIK